MVYKKKKISYNHQTLQFETTETPLSKVMYSVLGFIAATIVMALLIIGLLWRYLDLASIRYYKQKLARIESKYEQLNDIVDDLKKQLHIIEKKDNDIYRTIFQAPNIEDSLREAELSNEKTMRSSLMLMPDADIYDQIENKVYKLWNRMSFQQKSFTELDDLVKNKQELFKSTPAIQPLSNEDLSRIASGFGRRIDPIYKTEKFHEGMDFTAPEGTPIYATADGVVERKEFNGGYGNHVVVNHGFGYKTLYGHMSEYHTFVGKKVKRGEVIGYVGNTGKSVGPHCHYEVIKNGNKVNPVYYFFNDISVDQFQKITIIANQRNQSID